MHLPILCLWDQPYNLYLAWCCNGIALFRHRTGHLDVLLPGCEVLPKCRTEMVAGVHVHDIVRCKLKCKPVCTVFRSTAKGVRFRAWQ